MIRGTRILLWRILAVSALTLGILGIAVPVLPTVPFMIVAAWAGSKAWPALERRLLEHPAYSRAIRNWRERGAVPRKAKLLASLMMVASATALQFTSTPPWLQFSTPLAMLALGVWLWMRPNA